MMSSNGGRFSPFSFHSKPPTPPPKDPVYQRQTRLSTAPSSMSTTPSSSASPFLMNPKKRFLKFPKRSPTADLDPSPPREDEKISLPWNFQVRLCCSSLVRRLLILLTAQHSCRWRVSLSLILYINLFTHSFCKDSLVSLHHGQVHSLHKVSQKTKYPQSMLVV